MTGFAWRATCSAGLIALSAAMLGCNSGSPPASSPQTAGSQADIAGPAAQVNRRHPQATQGAAPGVFDFYLLTLSWSPEYCVSHPADAQCGPEPGFVLHGLWPENTNGTYPEVCSNAPGPSDPTAYKDIYPDQGLLEHEWTEHGTCSGLSPDGYFQLEHKAKASVAVPANLAGKQTPSQETPAACWAASRRRTKVRPPAAFC